MIATDGEAPLTSQFSLDCSELCFGAVLLPEDGKKTRLQIPFNSYVQRKCDHGVHLESSS
jgi:hypothetical protein